MDDSPNSGSPRTMFTGLGRRILWHFFGALATLVFMIGLMSVTKGNFSLPGVPDWFWILIAAIGFFGTLRYVRWYRS